MKPTRWKRVVCWLLAAALCAPCYAAAAEAPAGSLDAGGYLEYQRRHKEAAPPTADIVLPPDGLIRTEGENACTPVEREGLRAVLSPEGSAAVWSFTVEQEGYYNLLVDYLATDGTGGSMERNLSLDGKTPFNEARGILFKREFTYPKEKVYNVLGNEILPDRQEVRDWRTRVVTSPAGYIAEPLKFYLTAGEHTLSLEAVREPILYGELRLTRLANASPYARVKEEYEAAGYKSAGAAPIRIDAERPLAVSDFSVYPTTDRTSSFTDPPSVDKIAVNVIGGDNWKTPGQYVRYMLHVEKSGLYALSVRFKQDISQGLSVYRRLTVDGELPFAEAASLAFPYDGSWQMKTLGSGEEDYLFYLEKGERVLTLEAVSGEYAPVLAELNASLDALREIYRSLLMVTGPEPDLYRDYHFAELLPEVIEGIRKEQKRLAGIGEDIARLSEAGRSQVTAINNLVIQLEKMGKKPEKNIASNLVSFQSNISALGTFVMNATSQPLMLDYITVQEPGTPDGKGDTGFFGTLWHEIRRFVASFFNDYDVAGTASNEALDTIDVWISSGRDQAQIVRGMIDTDFIPRENLGVNLKLVAAGTLMPAILSGKGPDVSLGAVSTEPINLAIRNAVLDLKRFPDSAEVFGRFHESAMIPFTFRDNVYALPDTQSFLMMFTRADILEKLGLRAPDTWDDLFAMMLELQTNNLQIGLPALTYSGLLLFLTQNGGALYSGDASQSLLGADVGLSSFKQLTDFYKLYDFPVQYDFANRFRSGEMPIAIQEYTAYNQLVLFAPEIKGLWTMSPVPATRRPDGSLDRSTVGTVTGNVILRATDSPENSWKFLKWWTGADTQSDFGMRMESVLGESAKYATANREAMQRYSWSYNERAGLLAQWDEAAGIPETPGGYYSQRYVDFAFNRIINDNANPVETLEEYVPIITAELQRKLKEFGLFQK